MYCTYWPLPDYTCLLACLPFEAPSVLGFPQHHNIQPLLQTVFLRLPHRPSTIAPPREHLRVATVDVLRQSRDIPRHLLLSGRLSSYYHYRPCRLAHRAARVLPMPSAL